MPAEQGEEAPGKKYPDGSGDAADDDILASELTIEELKEAFRSVITEIFDFSLGLEIHVKHVLDELENWN